MIIEHLLFKRHFEKYIEGLNISPPKNLITDCSKDATVRQAVNLSRRFGALGIEHPNIRTYKARIVKSLITYMALKNYDCEDVLSQLYSEKTPGYQDKVNELKVQLDYTILFRKKYLFALRELKDNVTISNTIKEYLKSNYDLNGYFDFRKMNSNTIGLYDAFADAVTGMGTWYTPGKDHLTGLQKIVTENCEDKLLPIEEYKVDHNILIGAYIYNDEHTLSLSNLKILAELIRKAYTNTFKTEIKDYRAELDKQRNRSYHVPTKKLSQKNKQQLIKNCKMEGKNQQETIVETGISQSVVYRYWDMV